MDYVNEIARDKSPRIIAAMAWGTGQLDVVMARIRETDGHVVVLGEDPSVLAKLALLICGEGGVVLGSAPAWHQLKVNKRYIILLTWSKFEHEIRKNAAQLFNRRAITDVIGMEPWNATEKQLRALLDCAERAERVLLIGTPNSLGTEVSRLYHSGEWKTYQIRFMDSPRFDPQAAGRMIAQMGADRALHELLAEVPKI